jgi:nitrogen-specific signal transduction histidine kinase
MSRNYRHGRPTEEALCLVAETGRQLAQAKGLGWQAALPASGPWVWGDRTRLRQVVLNLANNLMVEGSRFSLPVGRRAAVLALVEQPQRLEPVLA